jgi:hypothetical protein
MNVSIDLSAEMMEELSRQAAVEGVDVPTFLREVVEEKLKSEDRMSIRRRSPKDFDRLLDEIIKLHPVTTTFVDDSRDSIYPDESR